MFQLTIGEKAPEPYYWLDKFAGIIGALGPFIWPAVLVFFLIYYRGPVTRLLDRIKHMDAPGGFKADMAEKELEKVEANTLSAVAKPEQDDPVSPVTPDADLAVVSGPNPFETVLKAWVQVEQEMDRLSEGAGRASASPLRKITWLAKIGQLNEGDVGALNELRTFRNMVVHNPHAADLTTDQALRYAESANLIASKLKQQKPRPPVTSHISAMATNSDAPE